MKFLELEFELTSPAIITLRRTATGFLSASKYIPSSTLRGALISSLYRNGIVENSFLKQENEKPGIVSSPAYPVMEGKKSYPCHPFAYECKFPHKGIRERYNYVGEVLPKLESGKEPDYKICCSEGHIALKPLHPDPVIPDGRCSLKRASVHPYRTVSVGMSKHRAASEKAMLFEYDAISAGQKFWSTLAVPDSLNIGKMEFAIGRGFSRGFGRAKITAVNELSLDERESWIKDAIRKDTIVLYSLSRTLSVNGDRYSPYPENIDLGEVARRCDFEAEGKLVIKAAYGRTDMLVGGWDMMKNVERPIFASAGSSGSIFVAKVEGGANVTRAIAALGVVGTIEFATPPAFTLTGLNMLTPLRRHPIGDVEE